MTKRVHERPDTDRPATEATTPVVGQEVAIKLFKSLVRSLAKLSSAGVLLATIACASKMPETRFYQLSPPVTSTTAAGGELAIALEGFDTDPGYDDDRMIYRSTPYRLDYYHYHRWSAAPGTMVGNFLEQALERSGQFRNVAREVSDRSPVVVRGRVVAIEEVDVSPKQWLGRLVVELAVVDPRSGAVLWTEQYEEREPLRKQSPEGLAEALSVAMSRIATRATPAIAEHARRQAQLAATRGRFQ